MKRYRAAVYGGSGFAGAELVRRLLLHPEVELVRVCSIDHVGEPLSSAHPHLEGATDLVFLELPPREAAVDVDIVLLGLPHTASIGVVESLLESSVKIIDMSGRLPAEERPSLSPCTAHAGPQAPLGTPAGPLCAVSLRSDERRGRRA